MELRGGFFRCMPGRMLIDPGEVGLALDAQIALRWRFLSPMFSRLSGLPWQASRTRNRKQPSRATECELPWLAKPPRPLSPWNVGTHGAVSLVLGDAVRRLPRKLRPVVMGPASRFACAGRRRWIWFSNSDGTRGLIVLASEAKQSIAHPQRSWIASLRSQ